MLKRIKFELYYFDSKGLKVLMNLNMSGDCTGLYGDCTGLSGDCTGLCGDIKKQVEELESYD